MWRKECKLPGLHSFLLLGNMTPKVSDLIEIVNGIAPFRHAEEWDNVGLQLGDPSAPVTKIMVSLDACGETVDAAIAGSCQLLATHHPLIFNPLRRIDLLDPSGAAIGRALRNSLNIVSLHTNFDSVQGGMNDLLAEKLGVVSTAPLSITRVEELAKLAVFVPKGHEEQVLQALFRFSGFIGNYSECSFQTSGTGTFKPLQGARPFIGSVGEREYADETRIEVLLRRDDLDDAVSALKAAHPYEEPAMDLYPLLNRGRADGFGRIGELENPMSLERFASEVKQKFGVEGIRFVGDANRMVRRVALCGGSGSSFLREAGRRGADVLVTGDVKYHEAREAGELGLAMIDLGHFASEIVMVEGLAARLESGLQARGFVAELVVCKVERDPFRYR
jgi:dinuclear metal center YbgI/SA1388 family protein